MPRSSDRKSLELPTYLYGQLAREADRQRRTTTSLATQYVMAGLMQGQKGQESMVQDIYTFTNAAEAERFYGALQQRHIPASWLAGESDVVVNRRLPEDVAGSIANGVDAQWTVIMTPTEIERERRRRGW